MKVRKVLKFYNMALAGRKLEVKHPYQQYQYCILPENVKSEFDIVQFIKIENQRQNTP